MLFYVDIENIAFEVDGSVRKSKKRIRQSFLRLSAVSHFLLIISDCKCDGNIFTKTYFNLKNCKDGEGLRSFIQIIDNRR